MTITTDKFTIADYAKSIGETGAVDREKLESDEMIRMSKHMKDKFARTLLEGDPYIAHRIGGKSHIKIDSAWDGSDIADAFGYGLTLRKQKITKVSDT